MMRKPDPIPELKRQLARTVVDRMDGWSQELAAAFLHTDQPRMSDLRNARLARFSLEQLIRFISRVEGTVVIQVTWGERRRWLSPRARLPKP